MNKERQPRRFGDPRMLALAGVITMSTGCVSPPVHELTMRRPPPDGSHLVEGQRLLVIGPNRIPGTEQPADYLLVVPIPSEAPVPGHTWHPNPMVATRKANSADEYTMQIQVTDNQHTNEWHTVTLKITSRRPFELEVTADPSIAHHGGTAHFED